MGLPVPGVGLTDGPQWAIDVNDCMSIIDAHDHSNGEGVKITPAGLNISSDLTLNSNNLYLARSLRFDPQGSPLGLPQDLGCIYETGVDLYYNDGNGNQIRITQSGSVVGTPGSITGMSPPASATYVAVDATFIWQQAVNTAAIMDSGPLIVRNTTVNSQGITITPPASLPSSYDIVLPALPVAQSFVTLDQSGNLSAPVAIANGITLSMLATALVQYLTPTGVIQAYGGTAAPTGWLMCDGSSQLRASYPDLFAVIGTAFGSVDGTHFNVPPPGLFFRGVDNGSGNDPDAASRTAYAAGGNTGDNVGSYQANQNLAHAHGVTDPGHAHGTDNAIKTVPGSGALAGGNLSFPATTVFPNATGISIQSSGGLQSNPNNIAANYIIKT